MRGRKANAARWGLLIGLCLAPLVLQPVPASAQDDSTSSVDTISPPSTTEIPPAVMPSQGDAVPAVLPPDIYNPGVDSDGNPDQAPPAELRQEMQSLRDFREEEEDNISSLGMVLREAHRGVDGNGEVAGLLVLEVMPGTPAAYAGLKGLSSGINSALAGAAFAASLFFPPAMLAAAVVSGTRVGESYDLIIGMDSERITNYLDFSERMRQVRAGEVVYLSVSRNGKRTQIPITIPAFSAAAFGSP
ncbi:MAG TPA: PDZ domain-containing protein [Candidatus Binataceae bacterium]|nr:PDZ domain-containing protein [Candidatus Binataceae bacterium]